MCDDCIIHIILTSDIVFLDCFYIPVDVTHIPEIHVTYIYYGIFLYFSILPNTVLKEMNVTTAFFKYFT